MNLLSLPEEILRLILRAALRFDIPLPEDHKLLLADSFEDALFHWYSPTVSDNHPQCTPDMCCHTRRGARSGQSGICYRRDLGSARTCLDLLAVCHHLREVVLADSLFWGQALLLRPRLLPEALALASRSHEPSYEFVTRSGSCLCVLQYILRTMESVTRLDLSLPSSNWGNTASPASMIRDALLERCPRIQHVSLRFDWAHAYADARKKSILRLQELKTCSLLNATFALSGTRLVTLHMAAEESVFRWRHEDIYTVLRLCPNLATLSLQMVFESGGPVRVEDQSATHGTVSLPSLRYLHICDVLHTWQDICRVFDIPSSTHIHPDIIFAMGTSATYVPDHLRVHCGMAWDAASSLLPVPYVNAAALRIRADRSVGCRWPEYMSLSLGPTVAAACAFTNPVAHHSAISFTARNMAMSLRSVDNPWLHSLPTDVNLSQAVKVFLLSVQGPLSGVSVLVIQTEVPFSCPPKWIDVLTCSPSLEVLVVKGHTSYEHRDIVLLARALGYRLPGQNASFVCPFLHSVILPDVTDSVSSMLIPRLECNLLHRYQSLSRRVSWSSKLATM